MRLSLGVQPLTDYEHSKPRDEHQARRTFLARSEDRAYTYTHNLAECAHDLVRVVHWPQARIKTELQQMRSTLKFAC